MLVDTIKSIRQKFRKNHLLQTNFFNTCKKPKLKRILNILHLVLVAMPRNGNRWSIKITPPLFASAHFNIATFRISFIIAYAYNHSLPLKSFSTTIIGRKRKSHGNGGETKNNHMFYLQKIFISLTF